MKIKTSELIGPTLDWAVAKCEGVDVHADDFNLRYMSAWPYSTDWSQGGPIIERERISVQIKHDGWRLACVYDLNDDMQHLYLSHDYLTAAMRAFVSSKLGDEVDIPDELTWTP